MSKEQIATTMQELLGHSSRAQAAKELDAILDAIREELAEGRSIPLRGFGTFSVVQRKPRTGRNPRTGEAIAIPAAKAPKFTPGKELKELIGRIDSGEALELVLFRELTQKAGQQMDDLKGKLDSYGQTAIKSFEDSVDKAHAKYEEVRDRLKELTASSGAAFSEVKTGVEKAFEELKNAFKKAIDKY